jgi:hypothetical protein
MTRAHANSRAGNADSGGPGGFNMRWRDCAIEHRSVSGVAGKRDVCSLTIRKVFVLTLSFQAKVFL